MIRLLRTALFPGHFLRGARPASPSSSFLSSSSSILAPSTTAPAVKAGQTLQRSRSRTTEYGGRDDDDDDDDDAAASLKAYSALKRRCAAKITSLVPGVVRRVYLSRSRDATEDDADRPTDDHAANTDLDRNSAHDHSAQDKDDTARDHAHDAHDDDGQDDANPLIFRALSYLDDAYVNKHLCYAVVELLVVRLLPELAEQRSLEHLVRARVGVSSVSSWT